MSNLKFLETCDDDVIDDNQRESIIVQFISMFCRRLNDDEWWRRRRYSTSVWQIDIQTDGQTYMSILLMSCIWIADARHDAADRLKFCCNVKSSCFSHFRQTWHIFRHRVHDLFKWLNFWKNGRIIERLGPLVCEHVILWSSSFDSERDVDASYGEHLRRTSEPEVAIGYTKNLSMS